MEGELWKGLYRVVTEVGKHYRSSGTQFSNTVIVLVYLWAVLHDRPTCWACRRENWPAGWEDHPLPSPATMSRRLRRVRVLTLIGAVEQALREQLPEGWIKTLDAKPLPVGGFSKDRDAKVGYAVTHKARGYKFFAVCDHGQAIDTWTLGPMNQSEASTALKLVPRVQGQGYLLGDSLYDINAFYDQTGSLGWQLLAPRKRPHAGLGHRTHSPYRLRSLALWDQPFGQALYSHRAHIERYFGQWGNFGGGLGPLPNWVRRPHRVALWVQAKILINAVRIIQNKGLAA